MAAKKIETEFVPRCPICFARFDIPKQLPCFHSFCETCLQSYIASEEQTHMEFCFVKCPVCKTQAIPSMKERPTSEWASLFPTNTVLQKTLKESNASRLCDACSMEGDTIQAEGFCVFCTEAMCGNCLKLHKRQKISKDHTIISVDELDCIAENVIKLEEAFTCSLHHGENIKYLCKDHKVPCCGTCLFEGHKLCLEVISLKQELPEMLCDYKSDETIADMKQIEIHLNSFMEINDDFVNSLQLQLEGYTQKIREGKKKLNLALDELEMDANTICKQEVTRIEEENQKCLSLIKAMKNSHSVLEAVGKYGSNLQKFIIFEKIGLQLQFYCNQVREKYMKNDNVTVDIKLTLPKEEVFSQSLFDSVKVAGQRTIKTQTLTLSLLQRPVKECKVQRISEIDMKDYAGNVNWYAGVSFLPGDRLMLADYSSNQCILLSPSFEFLTSHTLTGMPWNICVLDNHEVAVSMYNQNEIQILSVTGDVIRPVRMIKTRYNCNGIAAAENGDLVVNGYCDNSKCQWSVISTRGDVKFTHQYDSPAYYLNYIALNKTKTRVYVSVYPMNSLICFNLDGKEQFVYSPKSLRQPFGVAVDNYDNIYVLGNSPDSIHQLSPDGTVMQVIYEGVPKTQWAIGIHKIKGILIITNTSDERTKLHLYQLTYL